VAAWHWPGFSSFSDLLSGVYIRNDVSDYRSTPQ
jgi:peptide/nickel transport system substrate-binding protein/oligopeptide transport system substrate-binding protein